MDIHRKRHSWKGANKDYSRRVAFNLAALFLIFFTAIIPLETAFAQSTTDSTASSDTATSGTSSLGTTPGTTNNTSSVTPATPTPESTNQSTGVENKAEPTNETSGTQNSTSNATPSTSAPANPTASPALTPGVETGPNIAPVVYTSFNQNQLKIDQNTGALDTTYPIMIPPGRNNLQPDLDLVYNSEN